MKNTSPQYQSYVFVEILQNGALLADTEKPIKKGLNLKITTHYGGDLALPMYHLPEDIGFLKVDKKQSVQLILNQPWHGLLSAKGQFRDIQKSDHNEEVFELFPDDYASLTLNDLQLLVRIGTKEKQSQDRQRWTAKEPGSLGKLFVGNQHSLGLASLTTLLLFLGPVIGLALRPDDRPKRFEDLSDEYLLPFIAAEHFEHAPETLQPDLDRSDMVRSTIRYYRDLTKIIIGQDFQTRFSIPDNTIRRYEGMVDQQDRDIESTLLAQAALLEEQLAIQGTAVMGFAAVLGESYQGRLLRLTDKIEIFHTAMGENLEQKREFTLDFGQDGPYDYGQYKDLNTTSPQALSQLKAIRPWKDLTDENLMYSQAEELAQAARRQQLRLKEQKDLANLLTPDSGRPIMLKLPSFVAEIDGRRHLRVKTTKLLDLKGISFEKRHQRLPKEPGIGKLDSSLLAQFIKRRRLDLKLCFESLLRKQAEAAGTTKWRWLITTQGKAEDITLTESTIQDERFVTCIQGIIARWRYPKPKHGHVVVHHEFAFSRDQDMSEGV